MNTYADSWYILTEQFEYAATPSTCTLYEYVGNSNNITETLQSKFKEIQCVMCLLLTVSEVIMSCEQQYRYRQAIVPLVEIFIVYIQTLTSTFIAEKQNNVYILTAI